MSIENHRSYCPACDPDLGFFWAQIAIAALLALLWQDYEWLEPSNGCGVVWLDSRVDLP